MKYKLTKAEQETVINFDNELDTASIYTHDSRLIKKLRELRKQYPEQFILEHREHGSVTYTIPKRCVGIRPPYSEKRREQQRQEAKENGLPFMEKCRLPRYLTNPGQRGSKWDMAGSDGISRVPAVFRGKSLLTNKIRIV